jgi:ribose transport system ATP-binding protein/inositol transport system ATP-binding protein
MKTILEGDKLSKKEILKVESISKIFPGVKALEDVSIKFNKGEVHALLGENGAGKSTLMNILSGNYQPNEGQVFWQGSPVIFNEPLDAQKIGIAMIHQENSLFSEFSVMENIFSGHFYKNKSGFADFVRMKKDSQDLLKKLEIDYIKPETIVKNLSASEKQIIEIAKAISLNPKVMIMDEPTASLTAKETNTVMKIIRLMKENGTSIIYISHRMEEIFEIADVVSVLRDGKHIITTDVEKTNSEELIAYMVGRELGSEMESIKRKETQISSNNDVILSVRNFNKEGKFKDISFDLYKGEILGFSGLVGAGRTEIMEAIFGYNLPDSGNLYIKGKEINIKHPQEAISNGVAMLPEGRKDRGIFAELSVKENINMTNLPNLKSKLLLNSKREESIAENLSRKLNIKTPTLLNKIKFLSGGNQQKAILARWLSIKPEILILDEPTHGIDVGAKAEIYKIIENLVSEGVSIILVSSELHELLLLSHRLIVMYKGELKAVLDNENCSQKEIMRYATNQIN